MSEKISLTIVIPAYNEERHLKACLDSIAAQIEKPDEVIVVDNNSSDGTATTAKDYKFVKLIHESTQGIAHAHHAGFATARSDYIARIDADSVLPADWVVKVRQFYASEKNKETAITGSGYCENVKLPSFHRLFMDAAFVATRLLLGYSSLWGPNMVVPRNKWLLVANETCEEKPTTFDDFDIAIHLHKHGVKTTWIPALRVGVRMRHLNSPARFWMYLTRWPGTLRNHNDLRWVVSYAGCAVIFVTQYPIFHALRKSSHG